MPQSDFIQKVKNESQKCEQTLAQLEKFYLEETLLFGNIFKGWEFYLNLKKNPDSISQKKNLKILPKNRIFSLSSVTSNISKGIDKDEKIKESFKNDF